MGLVLLAVGVAVFGWGASHLGASFWIWVTPRRNALPALYQRANAGLVPVRDLPPRC